MLGFTCTFRPIFSLIPLLHQSASSLIANRRISEIRDKNQAKNQPKYTNKSQHYSNILLKIMFH